MEGKKRKRTEEDRTEEERTEEELDNYEANVDDLKSTDKWIRNTEIQKYLKTFGYGGDVEAGKRNYEKETHDQTFIQPITDVVMRCSAQASKQGNDSSDFTNFARTYRELKNYSNEHPADIKNLKIITAFLKNYFKTNPEAEQQLNDLVAKVIIDSDTPYQKAIFIISARVILLIAHNDANNRGLKRAFEISSRLIEILEKAGFILRQK
jgi:hypothetical protein